MAGNMIDQSPKGTQKGVSSIAAIRWSLTVPPLGCGGGGWVYLVIIWYRYSLSLEGQRDGSDHVAAGHSEGEILNVISVRWHKNSFRVVSDQKPSGGEAAVEGGD